MPLWGNSTNDESKPKWLRKISKVNDITKVFATNMGWVYRHDKGNGRYSDELLVAIPNLASKLGSPTVTEVGFVTTSITVGTGKTLTVRADFNEAVTVSGSPSVSLNGFVLPYYAAGSSPATGSLQFRNTNVTIASGTSTLTFGGSGNISTTSGTIRQASPDAAVSLSLSSATAVVLNVG